MAVTVEGYLNEDKLAVAIQQLTGDLWVGRQIALPGSRRKYDMAFRRENQLVAVEYDGDAHYRSSLKIKADREKDRVARESGTRLVRVPYWVQLDRLTLKHYFGLSANIRQDFPHGFIATELFPASFCELGIARFKNELDALPTQVRAAVIQSLKKQVLTHGLEFVLPSLLKDLVAGPK